MSNDVILIASEVLQWLLLLFLFVFLMATMQLLGRRSNTAATSIEIQGLKGVVIGEELVTDIRTHKEVMIRDLLGDQPILMIVTDPACPECMDAFKRLMRYEDLVSRSLVVVRGSEASTEVFATTIEGNLRVVMEHRGLGLSSYKPPFATVVDRRGSYVASTSLKGDENLEFLRGVLSAERGLSSPKKGDHMTAQSTGLEPGS